MTEYLLAVHGPEEVHQGEAGGYASEEEMQQAFADVGALNERLQAEGS